MASIFTKNTVKKPGLYNQLFTPTTPAVPVTPAITPPNQAIGQNSDGSYIFSKPPVQPEAQTSFDPLSNISKTLNDQSQSILDYYTKRKALDEANKNKQILQANSQVTQTEEAQKAGIQDLENQTNTQIAEEEQQAGVEQRQQARTAQDTRKRLQNQFAALGTLEGSQYGQEATRGEQDLANTQANTRASLGRTITGLRGALGTAKRNFVSTIANEKANLQARITQIEDTFQKGTLDYDKAIRDAIFGAQNKINDAKLEIYKAEQIEKVKNSFKGADFSASADLRKEFNTRVKADDFMKVSKAYQDIINATPTPAGDMSLIFSYMKLLDPNSTVREGEFATAQQTAGLPAQVVNQYNKVLSGTRLGQEQRSNFKSEAKNIYQNSANTFNQQKSYFDQLARSQGVDPQYVTGGFNTSSSTTRLVSPSGQQYEYDDPNDPEIQQAILNGYKQI